jgi:hypothetical protein
MDRSRAGFGLDENITIPAMFDDNTLASIGSQSTPASPRSEVRAIFMTYQYRLEVSQT